MKLWGFGGQLSRYWNPKSKKKKKKNTFIYQKKSNVKRVVDRFWIDFKKSIGAEDKIRVLKRYAYIVIRYTSKINTQKYRKGLSKKFFQNKYCAVCGGKAEHRHHIIQLHKGGTNTDKNIIMLCKQCHSRIHPWMQEEVIDYSLDKAFRQTTQ